MNVLFINIDFIRERITPIAIAQNKYSFREEWSANGKEQKGERTNITSAYVVSERVREREGEVTLLDTKTGARYAFADKTNEK